MIPEVKLERTKDGTPFRMIAVCSYPQKDALKAAAHGTARWRAKTKDWSMPLEPVILSRIKSRWPDVKIDQDLMSYFTHKANKQKEAYRAAGITDPFPEEPRLVPFQCASIRFLDVVQKAILGHEMGTGKTVIVCSAIKIQGNRRVLVLCPNNVKWSWAQHMNDWADRQPIVLEAGSRKEPLQQENGMEVFVGNQNQQGDFIRELLASRDDMVLIVNYAQIRAHWKILKLGEWDVFTIDEAHRAKNRRTTQSQACRSVAEVSGNVWMLTGTPVRNEYDDLWALLHICDPERFRSYWNFVNVHLDAYPGFHGGVEILGLRDSSRYGKMLAGYMFRKEKKEVLPELPDKLYNDIPLRMKPAQQEAYDQMEQEFLLLVRETLDNGEEIEKILFAPNVISKLIRLRQICLSPAIVGGVAESAKLEALKDLFIDLKHSGEPFVIYTAFRKFIPYITPILDHHDIPFGRIVGGQKSLDRRQVEEDLNSGKIQSIIGTISAMGEGLNLQKATTAVFTDIDWVPAVNLQAEDRIHRMGIEKSPTIIRLYHPNTVETDIRGANVRKQGIADETVGRVEIVRRMLERGG